jgi:hypothetical protein
MDTLHETALELLYELLSAPGQAPEALEADQLAPERGRYEGTVDALLSVGAISPEEAEAWRAHFAAGAITPSVTDADPDEASRVLRAFQEAIPEDDASDGGRARDRYEGALSALAVIGGVDRGAWDDPPARHTFVIGPGSEADESQWEGDWADLYPHWGTDQHLVEVIAGPAELLEGWRVLYGLRFTDDVVFAFWSEARANRRGEDLDADNDDDADGFDLVDDLGTFYGGGDAWGDGGFRGVSFPNEGPEGTPSWMRLVSQSGSSVAL